MFVSNTPSDSNKVRLPLAQLNIQARKFLPGSEVGKYCTVQFGKEARGGRRMFL